MKQKFCLWGIWIVLMLLLQGCHRSPSVKAPLQILSVSSSSESLGVSSASSVQSGGGDVHGAAAEVSELGNMFPGIGAPIPEKFRAFQDPPTQESFARIYASGSFIFAQADLFTKSNMIYSVDGGKNFHVNRYPPGLLSGMGKNLIAYGHDGFYFSKDAVGQYVPYFENHQITVAYAQGSRLHGIVRTSAADFYVRVDNQDFSLQINPSVEKKIIYDQRVLRKEPWDTLFASDRYIYAGRANYGSLGWTDGVFLVEHGSDEQTMKATRIALPDEARVTGIHGENNHLYVSTDRGFFVSHSFGVDLKKTLNQPCSAVFSKGAVVYLGSARGLSISSDNGDTFTVHLDKSKGLPDDQVNGIYVDQGRVYAATKKGIAVSP